MVQRTLLAVFAHPDDEAFGCGGTLAREAANGTQVILVCATRGEMGEISDPALATPDTLGNVREAELRNAAQVLGLQSVRFLPYRDSGMAGTADNKHPDAFANAPAEQVVDQLVQIIREAEPQIIITFDPDGGYGHPDHIAAHRHTVAAFHAAADARRAPGPPWRADRLFYAVTPRGMFNRMRDLLAAAGEDTGDLDQFAEAGLGWPDDRVNVTIDVSATLDAKWAALNAHRTQFGADNPFRRLPEADVRALISREYFVLADPPLPDGSRLADLWDGLA
jgi:mycothiol S-conjugate amidase